MSVPKPNMNHKRGPWSTFEDDLLLRLVEEQGANSWVTIAARIGTRTAKQCRERYHQNLKPGLNHEPITPEEGERIEKLVGHMGKKWADIARQIEGRSDNAIKNWWNGGMNRRKRIVVRREGLVQGEQTFNENAQHPSFLRPAPMHHSGSQYHPASEHENAVRGQTFALSLASPARHDADPIIKTQHVSQYYLEPRHHDHPRHPFIEEQTNGHQSQMVEANLKSPARREAELIREARHVSQYHPEPQHGSEYELRHESQHHPHHQYHHQSQSGSVYGHTNESGPQRTEHPWTLRARSEADHVEETSSVPEHRQTPRDSRAAHRPPFVRPIHLHYGQRVEQPLQSPTARSEAESVGTPPSLMSDHSTHTSAGSPDVPPSVHRLSLNSGPSLPACDLPPGMRQRGDYISAQINYAPRRYYPIGIQRQPNSATPSQTLQQLAEVATRTSPIVSAALHQATAQAPWPSLPSFRELVEGGDLDNDILQERNGSSLHVPEPSHSALPRPAASMSSADLNQTTSILVGQPLHSTAYPSRPSNGTYSQSLPFLDARASKGHDEDMAPTTISSTPTNDRKRTLDEADLSHSSSDNKRPSRRS